MVYTLEACACSMATMVMAPSEGGGGGALEEAVVDMSCRAATMTSTSRVVVEAYSSSRRRAMVHTQARASTTFSVAWKAAILLEMPCYRAAAA
jgi:hypothetical protein